MFLLTMSWLEDMMQMHNLCSASFGCLSFVLIYQVIDGCFGLIRCAFVSEIQIISAPLILPDRNINRMSWL